jgi:hypothetical protein
VEGTAEVRTVQRIFTSRRVVFVLLAATTLISGFYGIWRYVHSGPGAHYGAAPWDVLYYDLQLFVLGSEPLEGPPPFNPYLEVGRYLGAATTAYGLALAAWAIFGDTWRRWRRRYMSGHAIVVGTTPEARAIAAKRRETMRVQEVEAGDVASLRAAGIARASMVYACEANREDAVANIATALTAASLGRNLNIAVHVSDPELTLGLKARHIVMDLADDRLDFFSMDEMAAQRHVESDPFDDPVRPHILVAGAGIFGQAVVIEFARQWRQRSPRRSERVTVTLVDNNAHEAAERLSDRWPAVAEVCDIQPLRESLEAVLRRGAAEAPYRAYICHEDEQLALSAALSAVPLWRGGPDSLVVRLNRLGRHRAAFSGAEVLLDDLGGRLHLVNITDEAGAVAVALRSHDAIRDLAEAVHDDYVARRLAEGFRMGSTPALRTWAELSEDLRNANRAQVRDFATKLRMIGCTIAPRSVRVPAFGLRDSELERLAEHEHSRWIAERAHQGWRYGAERDDKRKLHPDLVEWNALRETSKEKDRDAVRNLPTIFEATLANLGLQIIRLAS